jgi:hypothetical protein
MEAGTRVIQIVRTVTPVEGMNFGLPVSPNFNNSTLESYELDTATALCAVFLFGHIIL